MNAYAGARRIGRRAVYVPGARYAGNRNPKLTGMIMRYCPFDGDFMAVAGVYRVPATGRLAIG